MLGLPVAQLDRDRSTNRLGLDSLMATDIRNRLRRDHGIDLTVSRLLAAPSLRALAAALRQETP